MRIFISYRRADTSGWVGRLANDLKKRFGRRKIFMDIDSIEAGDDFAAAIDRTIASCDVLLGIIGPNWASATSPDGIRRLNEPGDFVRLEIARALNRGIRVVPVLVGEARMPAAEQLPDEIKNFAGKQAHELSDSRWDYDVKRLIKKLDRRWWRRKQVILPGIALVLALGASSSALIDIDGRSSPSTKEETFSFDIVAYTNRVPDNTSPWSWYATDQEHEIDPFEIKRTDLPFSKESLVRIISVKSAHEIKCADNCPQQEWNNRSNSAWVVGAKRIGFKVNSNDPTRVSHYRLRFGGLAEIIE